MKILPLVLVALLAAQPPAQAQTRCSTDGQGHTTCRHGDGTTTRATTDAFGNATWRRSDGTTTRCRTERGGRTICR